MITGSASSCLADPLDHLQAAQLGEEHVEDDQRIVAAARERQAVLAVVRAGHRVALGLEPSLHELGDRRLVLDHKDAHAGNARWAPDAAKIF